jgi:hypothetical protein
MLGQLCWYIDAGAADAVAIYRWLFGSSMAVQLACLAGGKGMLLITRLLGLDV